VETIIEAYSGTDIRLGSRSKSIVEGPNNRIWVGYYLKDTTTGVVAYSDDEIILGLVWLAVMTGVLL